MTTPNPELASLAVNAANALIDEKRHYRIAAEENARLRDELDRVRAERDDLKKRAAELEGIGREAATALDELIEYCDDPGTANLGTRYRLKQALIGSQPHCQAEYGGPGYTHCELPTGHDGQHESALGNMRRATWGGGR